MTGPTCSFSVKAAVEVYLGEPDGINDHVTQVAVLPLPQPHLNQTSIQYPTGTAYKSVLRIRNPELRMRIREANYGLGRILILPGHFWDNAKNMLSKKCQYQE
jgi:hypothetical protein